MKIVRITSTMIHNSYALLDATILRIGDTVFSDIYIKKSNSYIIIIEAGVKLTAKLYNLLQKQTHIYTLIKEGTVHKTRYKEDSVIQCNTLLIRVKRDKYNFSKTLKLLYEANNQLFHNFANDDKNQINISCVEAIVESILFLIQKNEGYLKKIMPHLLNDYKLPVHSFNVALYALHIGHHLKFEHEELLKLGKAALLHDIGKKRICSIVNKTQILSHEEIHLTKQHSEYSVDYLRENDIHDSTIVDAVNQHHERYDGSGYPNSLVKSEITHFGSILAICDVFDALTVDKPHRKSHSTFESLKMMLKEPTMLNKFNEAYIKLLFV